MVNCLAREAWPLFGFLIAAVPLVSLHPTLAAVTPIEEREEIPKLELTASPLSNRYCWGDAEVFVSQITLQLSFRNSSNVPVILDKESVLIFRHVAARTADGALKGEYEYDVDLEIMWPNGEPKKPHIGRRPGRGFAVIQPGQAYEGKEMVAVVVRRSGMREVPGTFPPGDHFLQVEVATIDAAERIVPVNTERQTIVVVRFVDDRCAIDREYAFSQLKAEIVLLPGSDRDGLVKFEEI